jgi:hypothetical protein
MEGAGSRWRSGEKKRRVAKKIDLNFLSEQAKHMKNGSIPISLHFA